MLSSMLQHTTHKNRQMEPVDVQLPVFATRQFAYHTQNHFASSTPQSGSPKNKKIPISRRSDSKSSSKHDFKASKEVSATTSTLHAPAGAAAEDSDKKQPKGTHERKKKNVAIPPRFRAENQRKLMNRKKGESSVHNTSSEKTSTLKTEKAAAILPAIVAGVDTPKDTTELKKTSDDVCCNTNDYQSMEHHHKQSEQRSAIDLTLSFPTGSSPPSSRRSSLSGSEADDELFQDALSYLPVPMCSGVSSTSSSAFVTPASSRSHSPVHTHPLFEDSLNHSLRELEQKQELVKSTEDLSSCGSRVTITDDHVIDSSTFPYTFTHNSEINNDKATTTDNPSATRHYSSDTVFHMVVGDINVEVNGSDFDKSSFELPSSPVESSYDEHDSGCGMSIGSPSKSLKRPGLIYVPPEISCQIPRGRSLEFSSLSTTSPQSSICSSSPLSLSPSPTLPTVGSQSVFDGLQQWPDLTSKPPPLSIATDNSCHTDATHRPTEEDIYRVKQWHSNLLAQLRQQQEKLDQKKKQKEAAETSSLPPHFHMFLPSEAIPPLPLPYSSLPPLSTHIPPPPQLQGSILPSFFPTFPPPHSTPQFFMPPPPPAHMFERPPYSDGLIYPPPVNGINPSATLSAVVVPKQPPKALLPETTHTLYSKWVLWYDKIVGSHRNSFSDYQASLKQIYTVTSVEEFWKLFNNIKVPSELENSTNYHFFREGIKPLWEDPANRLGGKWVLTIKESPCVLDKTWLEVLLKLIGGNLVRRDVVNGVVVSRRKKGNRIAIWTNQKKKKSNLAICKDLVEALTIACGVQVEQLPVFVKQLSDCKNGLGLVFMHHTDSLRSGSSYQNESHIKLKDYVQDLLRDLR